MLAGALFIHALTALIRHIRHRIGIALLAILVGIHALLLLVAIGIFRLLLLAALILLRFLTLHMFGLLRITIGHDRSPSRNKKKNICALSGAKLDKSTFHQCLWFRNLNHLTDS